MNIEKITNLPPLLQLDIQNMWYVDNYLFIVFGNGQKVLLNEINKKIWDLSNYEDCYRVEIMNGRVCAGVLKNGTICWVDLNTMEILFEDNNAEYVGKLDDVALYARDKNGNKKIYNIEKKQYIKIPENYQFEFFLENNFYVFLGKDNKRYIFSADGDILQGNIEGTILDNKNNELIIKNENGISTAKIKDNAIADVNYVRIEDDDTAEPQYYNCDIVRAKKNKIIVVNQNKEVVKEFKLQDNETIENIEVEGDYLIIKTSNKKMPKQLLLNLKNGKTVLHDYFERWNYATTFTGVDEVNTVEEKAPDDNQLKKFNFYDENLEPVAKIEGYWYDTTGPLIQGFYICTEEGLKLLNMKTGEIKNTSYNEVDFHTKLPYGFGSYVIDETVRTTTGIPGTFMLEFFDENFNSIAKINRNEHNIKMKPNLNAFLVANNYIGILGENDRTLIFNKQGTLIKTVDGFINYCIVGKLLKFDSCKEFFDTITGEFKTLSINAQVDETGKVDWGNCNNLKKLLLLAEKINDTNEKSSQLPNNNSRL